MKGSGLSSSVLCKTNPAKQACDGVWSATFTSIGNLLNKIGDATRAGTCAAFKCRKTENQCILYPGSTDGDTWTECTGGVVCQNQPPTASGVCDNNQGQLQPSVGCKIAGALTTCITMLCNAGGVSKACVNRDQNACLSNGVWYVCKEVRCYQTPATPNVFVACADGKGHMTDVSKCDLGKAKGGVQNCGVAMKCVEFLSGFEFTCT